MTIVNIPSQREETLNALSPIYRRLGTVFASLGLVGCVVALGWCGEGATSDNEGVLLLISGQVIQGQIDIEGDRYRVKIANGEIRIRMSDVQFVCRTLAEGYRKKSQAIGQGDLGEHLRLARWCLDHHLLDESSEQLDRARSIHPDHPRVVLIERRLQLAREPVREEALPPVQAVDLRTSEQDLNSLVQSLPEGTVEQYTKAVQPLLLNGCSASKCHGSTSSSDFRLIRPGRGHIASRRMTQRNLHSTLRWIDDKQPGKSRLLSAAIEAHGETAQQPVLRVDSDQYRLLAKWIVATTQRETPARPSTVGVPEKALSQVLSSGDESSGNRSRRPRLPEGQQKPSAQISRDPFDPEEFNQQYHPPVETSEPAG